MSRVRLFATAAVAAAAVLALASCSSSGGGSASQRTIVVGLPTPNVGITPMYYAITHGLFDKDHITVKLQTLSAASVGPAVTGGNVDVVLGAANTLANIAGVPRARVIFDGYSNHLYLIAKPGVVSQPCTETGGLSCTAAETMTNLAQIADAHKTVALTAPGSSSETAARKAFAAVGKPLGDHAKPVYLQSLSAIAAGLTAGTVQVSLANVELAAQMKDKGDEVVADLTQWSDQAPWFANTAWASSHKHVLVRFIADYCAGAKQAFGDKAGAEATMGKYVQLTATQVDHAYEVARTAWACQPFSQSEIESMLSTLSPTPNVDPSSLVDNQFIDAVGAANWVKPQQ